MGLAIIVILVSIALLFTLQWVLKSPSVEPVSRAKESVLAANFLNTMLGTTTDCNGREVRELLRNCALTGGVTKCGAKDSCEYSEEIIKELFEKTFDKWNFDYHFDMTGSTYVSNLNFGTIACTGAREQKAHFLPVQPGFEITLTLEICR